MCGVARSRRRERDVRKGQDYILTLASYLQLLVFISHLRHDLSQWKRSLRFLTAVEEVCEALKSIRVLDGSCPFSAHFPCFSARWRFCWVEAAGISLEILSQSVQYGLWGLDFRVRILMCIPFDDRLKDGHIALHQLCLQLSCQQLIFWTQLLRNPKL